MSSTGCRDIHDKRMIKEMIEIGHKPSQKCNNLERFLNFEQLLHTVEDTLGITTQ